MNSPCLICGEFTATKNHPTDSNSFGDDYQVFLINILLEIPNNKIEDKHVLHFPNITKSTSGEDKHPLCNQCQVAVLQTKQIYSKIVETTREFRTSQKRIVETFKTTWTNPNLDHEQNANKLYLKQLISENNFNNFGLPLLLQDLVTPSASRLECPDNQRQQNILLILPLENEKEDNEDEDSVSIKEEQLSEDDNHEDNNDDLEYKLAEDPLASSVSESPSDSDSTSEPEPPPSPIIKKPRKQKSKPPTLQKAPPKKRIQKRKLSIFEKLHPDYKLPKLNSSGKYPCKEPACNFESSKKESLERHISKHHFKDNLYKCSWPNCSKSFNTTANLSYHLDRHKDTPRYKCTQNPDNCNEAFYTPNHLTRHVQKVHQKDNRLVCETCGMSFTNRDALYSHKYQKHGNPSTIKKKKIIEVQEFICDHCGKIFDKNVGLVKHIELTHKEQELGEFNCDLCDSKYVKEIYLKVHLWRKHNVSKDGYQLKTKVWRKDTQCKVVGCRRAFKSEKGLKKHMEERHGGGGGEGGDGGEKEVASKFKCKYCGKGFHQRWRVDHHEEVHENKERKPVKCEICGRGYPTAVHLKYHQKHVHKMVV